MGRFKRVTLALLFLSLIMLYGCQDLVPHDTQSLLIPKLAFAGDAIQITNQQNA